MNNYQKMWIMYLLKKL